MKILFDVTDVLLFEGNPTGIVRVQLKLLTYLLNAKNINTTFVYFSYNKCLLYTASYDQLTRKIEKISNNRETGNIQNTCFRKYKTLLINRIRSIPEIFPLFRYGKKIWRFYKNNMLSFKDILALIPLYKSDVCSTLINDGDIFITAGPVFLHFGCDVIAAIKSSWKVRFISIVHDLLPLSHPQFYLKEPLVKFNEYYCCLANYCDCIVCVSDFSKESFISLIMQHYPYKNPVIKTISLGSDIIESRVDTSYGSRVIKEDYILYVSTIEIKKNHVVLLHAWLQAAKKSIAMPTLVFVGRGGSESLSLLYDLYNSSHFLKEKVLFLSRVDDKMLDNLYRNCLFTVFPSIIEGWGLGVTESLVYGKVCVISTAPSLNEAAQGLMPRIDPYDVEAWMNNIIELTYSVESRELLGKKINTLYKPKTWEKYVNEFFSFVLE